MNIPTSAVTFNLLGGSPYPNTWYFYLRSSDEVSANGPMTMPTSKNNAISHEVAYTKHNIYSVTQPILAGCYTVAVLDKNSSNATEATLGSTTDDKVLCVGDDTPATVDFDFTTKQISINP